MYARARCMRAATAAPVAAAARADVAVSSACKRESISSLSLSLPLYLMLPGAPVGVHPTRPSLITRPRLRLPQVLSLGPQKAGTRRPRWHLTVNSFSLSSASARETGTTERERERERRYTYAGVQGTT